MKLKGLIPALEDPCPLFNFQTPKKKLCFDNIIPKNFFLRPTSYFKEMEYFTLHLAPKEINLHTKNQLKIPWFHGYFYFAINIKWYINMPGEVLKITKT